MLKSIEELHKKDKLASMNGDLETLLTLFTDDGIAIPAEGEIIEGKEALLVDPDGEPDNGDEYIREDTTSYWGGAT
jgi:ketosteroid isomerase-like protein